jgi:hypothetical protein
MPRILDRSPISTRDELAFVCGDRVQVKAYEIIVWVSLLARRSPTWDPATPRFPAILDTGHTHNFSIQEQHLVDWAGLQPDRFRLLGTLRQAGQRAPLYVAEVWLHRNQPGQRDQLLDATPYRLVLPRGIAGYPKDSSGPRLPLLGLRALITNRLHLTIDGAKQSTNLRTERRWWFF